MERQELSNSKLLPKMADATSSCPWGPDLLMFAGPGVRGQCGSWGLDSHSMQSVLHLQAFDAMGERLDEQGQRMTCQTLPGCLRARNMNTMAQS